MTISEYITDLYIHWWLGIPRPIPGPLAYAKPVERVDRPVVKVKTDGWEDMQPIRVKYDGGKEEIKALQRKDDGLVTYFRPKGKVASTGKESGLTEADMTELAKRKVSQETGEKLKLLFYLNPEISAGAMSKESGLGMRTCENALAAFRAAENEK